MDGAVRGFYAAPMSLITGIRACVFDAYGTIFDIASAAARCASLPPGQGAALTATWRERQLQYTWLRTLQGRYVDFWQVTGDALDYALDAHALAGAGLRDELMDCYRTLAAFPEVPDVLRRLRRSGFVTAILSNGSPAMLQAAVSAAGLDAAFDAVYSADAVRVYKTHPAVYRHALERLALPAAAVCFLSSNAWDAHAAADFGMRVVWCNRYAQRRERLPGTPDREIRSLADLPELLDEPLES
jgi:2-haloacid dehalogenase